MSYNPTYAIEAFTTAVTKNFWNVDGRMSRRDFWHAFTVFLAISIAANIISMVLGGIPGVGGILAMILSLAMLVLVPPQIGMGIRRAHDTGRAWWHFLIPFYNLWVFAQPATDGPNEYGEDPRGSVGETFA